MFKGISTARGCQDLSWGSGPLVGIRTSRGCQDLSRGVRTSRGDQDLESWGSGPLVGTRTSRGDQDLSWGSGLLVGSQDLSWVSGPLVGTGPLVGIRTSRGGQDLESWGQDLSWVLRTSRGCQESGPLVVLRTSRGCQESGPYVGIRTSHERTGQTTREDRTERRTGGTGGGQIQEDGRSAGPGDGTDPRAAADSCLTRTRASVPAGKNPLIRVYCRITSVHCLSDPLHEPRSEWAKNKHGAAVLSFS
ncbi:hypothetical protein WMY93_000411 [Mugilogobius chulae]|uniref:Uncharacterized protein n=1 Tax=Mugilogobius chulae TaxID=88201 RepID=A0AAW0Q0U3_9GOBI